MALIQGIQAQEQALNAHSQVLVHVLIQVLVRPLARLVHQLERLARLLDQHVLLQVDQDTKVQIHVLEVLHMLVHQLGQVTKVQIHAQVVIHLQVLVQQDLSHLAQVVDQDFLVEAVLAVDLKVAELAEEEVVGVEAVAEAAVSVVNE